MQDHIPVKKLSLSVTPAPNMKPRGGIPPLGKFLKQGKECIWLREDAASKAIRLINGEKPLPALTPLHPAYLARAQLIQKTK